MVVREINGMADFKSVVGERGKLIVVDFTATWCGPCQRVAPAYQALSDKYPTVLFSKVVEDNNKDLIMALGIRSFPTFRFYLDGQQVDEMSGANPAGIEAKVVQHMAKVRAAFEGAGQSLGGGGSSAAVGAQDARAARLARFGAAATAASASSSSPPVKNPNAELNKKLLAADGGGDVQVAAMDVDKSPPPAAAAAAATGTAGTAPVGNRAVDTNLLNQMKDMGFPEERSKKALMLGNGPDLESAINWLMEHQDDADIDEPMPDAPAAPDAADRSEPPVPPGGAGAGAAANSLKCDDCTTLLRDMTAAELHAHKTGHSNFSESSEAITPLTPEEKAAKLAALKEKIAERRSLRENEEKQEKTVREKARRTMGKEMSKTRDEMAAQARKRDMEMRKKEKEEQRKERERLRAEIAKDKAERQARGGKLAGKLSVDGYNPSVSASLPGLPGTTTGESVAGAGAGAAATSASVTSAPQAATSADKMSKSVELLAKQQVGGEGGTAMKTLLLYTKNILEKPDEEKFRTINLDNKAFKTRVGGCLGGVAFLKALGFVKDPTESKLVLALDQKDDELIRNAKAQLEAAIASYQSVMARV
ncbi:unnamed protein product [Chrysoparadoxa australica]